MSSLIGGVGLFVGRVVAALDPGGARRREHDRVREGLLEYRPDSPGPGYRLAGRPLRPGDLIEAASLGGWAAGAFSWSGQPEDLPCLLIEAGNDEPVRAVLRPTVRCRWPEPGSLEPRPEAGLKASDPDSGRGAPDAPTSAAGAG